MPHPLEPLDPVAAGALVARRADQDDLPAEEAVRRTDQVADVRFLVGVVDRDRIGKTPRVEPFLQGAPPRIQTLQERFLILWVEPGHRDYDTLLV